MVRGSEDCRPPLLAADLDDPFAVERYERADRLGFGSFSVSSSHRYRTGLYALTVVPRAPNFSALRRVSSNFERAYVSTSCPVSIRSKP